MASMRFLHPAHHSVAVATGDEIKLREMRYRINTENNAPRGRVLPSQRPFEQMGEPRNSADESAVTAQLEALHQ